MLSDDLEKAQIVARLERVQALIADLEKATTDSERQALRARINREVDSAKVTLRTLGTHDPI